MFNNFFCFFSAMAKKVLVTGTFDIVHPGHLNLFKQAKEHGDELIILVARDETVKEVKGKLPANPAVKRAALLKQLRVAKKVILGDIQDKYLFLSAEKPDIICLGYDQEAFVAQLEDEIKKRGLMTEVVRLKPFKPETYKTSKLLS